MAESKDVYVTRAFNRAFGDDGSGWDPNLGYQANRPRIVRLYDYYRDTYNQLPGQFLWAGLGRMAGGAVVGGLDFLSGTPGGDPTPITTAMVQIGKAIFEDLAWLHEAFLDDANGAIALAAEHDADQPARRGYADALTALASGDPAQIVAGNAALLEIEQFSIIQPLYDTLRSPSNEAGPFRLTRTATGNVHPYHRDFLTSFPSSAAGKDVTVFDDRWEWINLPGGMWEKWSGAYSGAGLGVDDAERTRLVNLPFDNLLRQDWITVDQSLLPPGGGD